jgi:sucrose-phosphate synthase
VPDVIHGHYADAGYGGGQLARLLGIPFVFTGHSLGRVKRQRLLDSGLAKEKIESRYNLAARIEAEEFALETCSLICTSTRQEVKEQYEQYENYIPERMEVIPPGVDLDAFHPPVEGEPTSDLEKRYPRIPARAGQADDRGNGASGRAQEPRDAGPKVYGESPPMQRAANLVLIMGSRDDIRAMPSGQRAVLTNILTLIDVRPLRQGRLSQTPPGRGRGALLPAGCPHARRVRQSGADRAVRADAAGGGGQRRADRGHPRRRAQRHHRQLQERACWWIPRPEAIRKAILHVLIEPGAWEEFSKAGIENVHIALFVGTAYRALPAGRARGAGGGRHAPPPIRGRQTRRLPQIDRLILRTSTTR